MTSFHPGLRRAAMTAAVPINVFIAIIANFSAAQAQISGFAPGAYVANGGPGISNDTLTITAAQTTAQAKTLWFRTKQGVAQFDTSFFYQVTARSTTGGDANGFTLTLQNQSLTARGGTGGYLAIASPAITPSVSFQFNINGGSTVGVGVNGTLSTPTNTNTATGVNLDSGNPILVRLQYDASVNPTLVTETLTDQTTGRSFTTTFNLPDSLATLLGAPTAYVGFTGSTGSRNATQQISWFRFGPRGDPNFLGMNIRVPSGAHSPDEFITVRNLGLGSYRPGATRKYEIDQPLFDRALAVGLTPCPVISPRVEGALAVETGQTPKTLGNNSNFPAWYAAWRTYCQDVMTRNKGKIFYYIVDNEPDKDQNNLTQFYRWDHAVQFTRIAYQVAKQVDPRIQIECPPVSRSKVEYLHEMLQGGIANYCDYIGLHMYNDQIDERYFTTQNIAAPWIWMSEGNAPLFKPLSCSENGVNAGAAPAGAIPRQWSADWLNLNYLQLKRYGYSHSILFDWSGAAQSGDVNWGLCVDPNTRALLQPTYSEIQDHLRVSPFNNGGFESATDIKRGPWVVYHSSADALPPAESTWIEPHFADPNAKSGAYSALFRVGANSLTSTNPNVENRMFLRQVAQHLTPGATYTLSAWTRWTGSQQGLLRAEGFDPLDGDAVAEAVAEPPVGAANQWRKLSVTIRPSTTSMVISLYTRATGVPGDVVYFDDVQLVQTAPAAVPAAPAAFGAYPGDGEVHLRWTPVPGATGYRIYRSDNGAPFVPILAATGSPYTDPTVTAGGSYGYVVRAFNGAGESAASSTQSVVAGNGLPDLEVTNATAVTAVPTGGGAPVTTFTVRITNTGDAWTPPGTVLGLIVLENEQLKPVAVNEAFNTPLAPGAYVDLVARWTAPSGDHTVTVKANRVKRQDNGLEIPRITESDGSNNSRTITFRVP
ncbi:MAG: hypothetical protein H7Z41_05725 [Cytophagales bacterium]|nr:hypothetical protein [Armatimonadota bacterium]